MNMPKTLTAAVVAAIAWSGLSGFGPIGEVVDQIRDAVAGRSPAQGSDTIVYATPDEIAHARSTVDRLVIKGRSPSTGYNRNLFLPHNRWPATGKGCTVRDQIVRRDLTSLTYDSKRRCHPTDGSLLDPYSNREVALADAELEHFVALENAYALGGRADTFTPTNKFKTVEDMRHALAVDPDNLAMVSERYNAQKRSSDIATWVPPHKGYRCTYAVRIVTVKERYGIATTPSENKELRRYLTQCP